MNTPVQRPADPFPVGLQRFAAASGILFAVLLIAVIAVTGDETPDFDAPVQEWSAFAADNSDGARIGILLMGLAVYEWLWFLSYLRGVIGPAEVAARGFSRVSRAIFAGGILAITGIAAGVFMAGASLQHEDADPQVIRGLNDVAGSLFQLGMVGFAVMFFALGTLVLRVGGFPRWLGVLGAVTGVSALLTLGVTLSDELDNAFGIFYPLTFLGIAISSIGWSVLFLRGLRRDDAVPPTTAV